MSELEGIAIVAMHGRFPGAESVEQFWQNLVDGRETVSFFSEEELARAGLNVQALNQSGNYVPARGVLRDAECFDRDFFGIHPKEAEVMDPQHRVFLEGCWEALERAGYAPGRIDFPVGIYCGATFNTYFSQVLQHRSDLIELVGHEQVMFGNEKDYIATRAAYKLNLSGPAISLDTACSSSLTAICQACQSLLTYQCDMAVAGGVSVRVPQEQGYYFQEGNIGAPDGHTRTFDAAAQGTVFSNGLALVVLKRVEESIADGDQIYGVIKGFAINNDGADRVSFTAPGIQGQAEVIATAQALAGVEPDDISYIEAHGTATPVGDPIEVAALTDAFRRGTSRKQFCAIGSVKSNVGHLDAASGATGLIKTALSLHHRLLPASLHFESPNPKLDLEHSPFYVNSSLQPWNTTGSRNRCAGVSSFGTGGTNAHVVVEEIGGLEPSGSSRAQHLLLLSAKTPEALERMGQRLASFLQQFPDTNLADAAYTLQVGRSEFTHRQYVVCSDSAQACEQLRAPHAARAQKSKQEHKNPPVVFMFPGQGSQFAGMGAALYRQEALFREIVDECAELLQPTLQEDLRQILFPTADQQEAANHKILQTQTTQPALFVVEYALAKLWISWGVRPTAMIGHSVGEFVAACLSGVMQLPDALMLIAQRAKLVQSMPHGSMLSVRASEADILPLLNVDLAIAAVNSPTLCVVAGTHNAVDTLEKECAARGLLTKRLRTSHAFHSQMMDPVVEPFLDVVRGVPLSTPQIPYVSNVTADWIHTENALRPEYWAEHVRQPVRFSSGIEKLLQDPTHVLLEVGPGSGLTQLALQHPNREKSQRVVPSLPFSEEPDAAGVYGALGSLWLSGVDIDWKQFYAGQRRRRIVLPTYPFERTRCWPTAPAQSIGDRGRDAANPNAAVASDGVTPSLNSGSTNPNSLLQPVENCVATASPILPRKERFIAEVGNLLEELSGIDMSTADPTASLFEFGLDSLLLTQVATLLQNRFGTKITFRQLMEELTSINAIAVHLDAALPADALPTPLSSGPVETVSPAVNTAASEQRAQGLIPTSTSNYVGLLEQHLAVTTQLLQSLRQTGNAPALPVAKAGIAVRSHSESKQVSHGPFRPLDRNRTHSLTAQQQQSLEAFIARYTSRTATSKKLAAQNRSILADPRSVGGFKSLWKEAVYPIHTTRSGGSRIWDVDNNEYVDFVMGFGASLLGHRPPFVVQAVKEQLDAGFETGPIHPLAGEVARLVSALTGAERVGFCGSGSEAVLAAIRVSRTVTGRDKIVIFEGAYHGIFDEVLARPLVRNGELRSMPTAPGIPNGSLGEIIVLAYGSQESLEIIERHAHEIAAVLVEPVQARRLDLVPTEFLHQLRSLTQATGTALVFDEVVTGFRLEPGGAQAYFGIRADLATYGKVVGGGLPIGVVTGRAQYMDALDGGPWQYGDDSTPEVGVTFFAGTFVRHPLALAAAKSVLVHLQEQGPSLQMSVARKAERVAVAFRELFEQYRAPFQLSHFSSLIYVSVPNDFTYGGLLFYHLRDRGIHIFENRLFIFSTEHTDADCQKLIDAMASSLAEMQQAGFLPNAEAAQLQVIETRRLPHGSFPLTAAQEEIWLAASMSDELNCSYNQPLRLHFRGELQIDALRQALSQLVARHAALRLLINADGRSQQIQPAWEMPVPLHDLSGLSVEELQKSLQELGKHEAVTPFDLQRGPLVRACVMRISSDEHILFLTAHHLVADGYSCGLLVHDLGECYSALYEKRELCLEEPATFADYAWAESDRAGSSEAREVEEYWLQRLHNPPPVLDLPTDFTRPTYKTFAADRLSHLLPKDLVQDIATAASREGCSVFTWLFAAFTTFLQRLSGQNDFVVAIVAADQAMTGQHNLVGHTANLLPIRVQVEAQHSFRTHLKQIKSHLLDAFEKKDITFGSLLKKLRIARDPSRAPLVSIVMNMDPDHAGVNFAGLNTEIGTNARRFENFDWFFNIIRGSEQIELECTFNSDLFSAESIAARLEQFETLLRGLLPTTDEQLATIPLLSTPQRFQILNEWNNTQREYPADRCVHELFVAQAGKHPRKLAVVSHSESLTYEDLDRRSNQLANCLIARGVGTGDLVALSTERTPEMLVGLLGILKAGAAYVPIDPKFPRDRIEFMLNDSQAKTIVAHRALRDRLPTEGLDMVELDDGWLAHSSELIARPVSSESRAYLIYTSGSTGRPKGVQVSHRAFVNFLYSMQQTPGMKSDDVLLAITTLSFDIAGLELFLPLICGAKVVLATAEEAADGHRLASLLAQHAVTVMQATPITWRMLIEAGWSGSPQSLKILCGGEAFPRDLIQPLSERCCELWNLYGPTETTVWSSIEKLSQEDEVISIGRPIANTQMVVLDPWLNPVPVGVAGELFIGGEGLAIGYLNRPELTQEKFIDNPWADMMHSSPRIYRTGDTARYLPDGRLQCLGRTDNQVKIRGFRIELGEIEAVLLKQSGIRDCAVVAKEFTPGDHRLIAYVVLEADASLEASAIAQSLQRQLPHYMVPASIIEIDELPLTPNNKIDRLRLVQRDVDSVSAADNYQAPSDQVELHLSRLWEDLLGAKHVGIHDDFFQLGGHSLLAVQLVGHIEKIYGKRMPLATLLQHRTVAELAKIIRSEQWRPQWNCLVPLRAGGSRPPLFLVHAAGGNVLIYDDLARHLGDQQPVYGIQAMGMDGHHPLPASVAEMAKTYREEIQELQPSGPYLLAGYCLGGTVALEIAAQLTSQGEQVAFLGMLDAHNWANVQMPSFIGRWVHTWQNISFHMRNFWQLSLREKHQFFLSKMREVKRRKDVWRDSLTSTRKSADGTNVERSLANLWANNDRITIEYRPRPYAGRITYFCPILNYTELNFANVGWDEIAEGGVDTRRLSVYPAGMLMEPFVQQLAEEIADAISISLTPEKKSSPKSAPVHSPRVEPILLGGPSSHFS